MATSESGAEGKRAITIAVTGSSGYVGGALARSLESQGLRVVRLQRRGADGNAVRHFVLGDPVKPELFNGIDGLVHCAYDFSATKWPDIHHLNVEATLELFRAAKQAGVKNIIFISSMSAFDGCRSMYGRAKLEVEERSRELGVISVRPGLVYGGETEGGMVGALSKLLKIPGITPLVGTGRQVLYLVQQEDLGRMVALLAAGATPAPHGPLIAAHSRPFTFREILESLAKRGGRRKPTFLPVPWRLEWLALKSAEAAGLRLRLRSDSLISLINQDKTPDFRGADRFAFREFGG